MRDESSNARRARETWLTPEACDLETFKRHIARETTPADVPLAARIEIGSRVVERPLVIDQIGIEADARRLFLGLRFPFRYVVHPREVRRTTLLESTD